jgi:hypothetical protein
MVRVSRDRAVLRASSTRSPNPESPAHTRPRTSASFSPIPAVKTSASTPPSAAAYAPTVHRIR